MSEEFQIEGNDDCIVCKCGQKYHISVMPVWQRMRIKILTLDRIIMAIREITSIKTEDL